MHIITDTSIRLGLLAKQYEQRLAATNIAMLSLRVSIGDVRVLRYYCTYKVSQPSASLLQTVNIVEKVQAKVVKPESHAVKTLLLIKVLIL